MKKIIFLIIALLIGLATWGCEGRATAQQPTAGVPPTVVSNTGVQVEGKLVPQDFVNLSFNMAGTVDELTAAEGQQVQAGQVIARLDQHTRLSSALASADLEVVNASQALKTLNENTDVSTAAALQKVADARDAVRYAERRVTNLESGARQTDINSAKADVVLIKDKLDKANKDFAQYANRPEDNVTRALYLSKMADAQRKYDDAVRLLNNLQGTPSDIDLSIAQANLSLAQAQLALAENDYEKVKSGPDPDQLVAAQARLKAAESAQASAQAALTDAELVAPIAGTLVKLDLKVGEQALPGQQAAVIADFSQWKVETKDPNEMDIPRVKVGQSVTVTPDALPDLKLKGVVDSISQVYVEQFGDITYTAKIVLKDVDPRLRWGMTTSVQFLP